MKIEFVAAPGACEILALLVHEGRQFAGAGAEIDGKTGGSLTRAMSKSRLTGAAGQSLSVTGTAGADADTIVLIGAGEAGAFDDLAVEAAETGHASVLVSQELHTASSVSSP